MSQVKALISLLVLINVAFKSTDAQNPLLVSIDDGDVIGRQDSTVGLQKTYYAFQGIPFAAPPVGNLRFKPPVQNAKWTVPISATQDKSECVQGGNPVTGSEDCLYINVYTPNLTPTTPLSVMVSIYGGGFTSGNSSYIFMGPDYFLEQDVVFVSFNYRIGMLGFMSTGDLASPGNNGLRDQILALKWVQRNIAQFGGNPNNVTIFGQSAGAASVSYLLQTPQTEGLFQAAIMESGTSLSLWALTRNARAIAVAIGQDLGIDVSSSQAMVAGFTQIDAATLQESASRVSGNILLDNPLNGLAFSPVIEPVHADAVVSGKSHQLLSTGNFHRVPTIIGYNSNEAAAGAQNPVTNILLGVYFDKFLLNPSQLIPAGMNVLPTRSNACGVNIRLSYFSILPAVLQINNFLNYVDDNEFVRPCRQAVLQQSKYAPVYFYEFSYEGALGGVTQRTVPGVGHTEEVRYLFRTYPTAPVSASDQLTRSRMIKLWTNFAKFGNPTPTADPLLQNTIWSTAGAVSNSLLYLDINASLENKLNPDDQNMKYWDQLYTNYGNPPYDTY